MPRAAKRKVGRPVTVPNGIYISVKFPKAMLNKIERIGGPAAGTRPATIRRLVEAGIAAHHKAR